MEKRELERTLGFWDILLFGIGGIVGAGIYAIIGKAAGMAGNMLWVSFVSAAVAALLTGLSYSEFVSRFPDAGGSFEYVKRGLGEKTAFVMSVFMAFTGIAAAAAIAISFSGYLGKLLAIDRRISIACIIALMAFFNIIGSKYSAYYNSFATVITLLGLAVVLYVSLPEVGSVDLLDAGGHSWEGVMSGAALIFFSYVGFEDLVKMAEETKNPKQNLPRGVMLSGIIALVIYVLIAIASVSTLGADRLASSAWPLASVIEGKLGQVGSLMLAVVALFATSKTILSNILGTSRLLYDVARDSNKAWLKAFTAVSKIGNAPNYAIILISILSFALALAGELQVAASVSNIFIFIVFGTVNIALIRYRIKIKGNDPEEGNKIFRIPLNIYCLPVSAFLAILFLAVFMVFNVRTILTEFF